MRPSCRFFLISAVMSVLTVAFCATPQLAAFGDDSSEEGVLVLTNGQTLSGRVTRLGDRFVVTLPTGEIRVKVAEVEFACRSLSEAYQRKLSRISADRPEDRLVLAEWCLKHGLVAEAEAELMAARKMDADHPRVDLVERKLAWLRNPPPTVQRESREPSVLAIDPATGGPSSLESLPAGAVESFTRVIQPLLINRCGTAACHGSGSENGWKISRLPAALNTGSRVTERNLRSTLALVDRTRPLDSPLLQTPIRAHGSRDEPVFTMHELDQYRDLVEWVKSVSGVTGSPPVRILNAVAEANEDSEGVIDAGAELDAEAPQRPESLRLPGQRGSGTVDPSRESARQGEGRESAGQGSSADHWKPVDPFDPEIFNRRFFGGR